MTDAVTRPARPASWRRWAIALGGVVLAIGLLAGFWDWDWFRPLAEARASAVLGRKVTLRHFALQPGRQAVAIGDGVSIANPAGFDATEPFATIERVRLSFDVWAFLHDRRVVIPTMQLEHLQIAARQLETGEVNWLLPDLIAALAPPADPNAKPAPQIGALTILDGHAHVIALRRHADLALAIATTEPGDGKPPQITIDGTGSLAGQPVSGRFVGGALLSLRDAAVPYPVELRVANGPTQLALTGTIRSPLDFTGADLTFEVSGTDMALLLPLVGIPTPKTPPYRATGRLDIADGKVLLRGITGIVGSTDLAGDLEIDPRPERTVMTGALTSRVVDLADLGGFIGSEPGRIETPNLTVEQRRDLARAQASPRLLPTVPISLPTVRTADIHLTYHGAKIAGASMPFDSLTAKLDIDDGHIRLTPLTLGVGGGQILATLDMVPEGAQFRTIGDISIERLDVARMLAATHLVQGSGVLNGKAKLTSIGDSMASVLSNGDGTVQAVMGAGGDLSALMLDLSGFRFGSALFSAMGIPNREAIRCFVGDFAMQHGILNTRTFLLDTTGSVVNGIGTITMAAETLDLRLKTDSKHFSIGTLPAWIGVSGPFKNLSVHLDIATLGARAGVASGLGLLFPPAALLPTIQFGVGNDNRCSELARRLPVAK